MRALALAVVGLLLSGCASFMDGFCARDNKPGGYCESYNSAPRPVYVAPALPSGNWFSYPTQDPAGSGSGTLCTPVPDAVAKGGTSIWCR
jgi:hypothetical protein